MSAIVEISNLTFAYRQQPVLQNLDLSIDRGTTVGLIGPNGGGKTTLIKLLMGLLRPSAGSIVIDGKSPALAIRQGDVIGYLPQSPVRPESFPLSVRQTVHLGLSGKTGMLRQPSREDRDFADFLLERVGLAGKTDFPVGQLS